MKCNMGFWHCQNIGEDFHVFKEHFLAIIEHHYGNHKWCVGAEEGGWCQYKNDEEKTRKLNYKINFGTKKVNIWSSTKRSRPCGLTLLQMRCFFNCSIHSGHRKMSH